MTLNILPFTVVIFSSLYYLVKFSRTIYIFPYITLKSERALKSKLHFSLIAEP